jgi:hypothetical protein
MGRDPSDLQAEGLGFDPPILHVLRNSQCSSSAGILISVTSQTAAPINCPMRPTSCSLIGTRGDCGFWRHLHQYLRPSSSETRKEPEPPAVLCCSGNTATGHVGSATRATAVCSAARSSVFSPGQATDHSRRAAAMRPISGPPRKVLVSRLPRARRSPKRAYQASGDPARR